MPTAFDMAENALAMHMSIACNESYLISDSSKPLYKQSIAMLNTAIKTAHGGSDTFAKQVYDYCVDNGESVRFNVTYIRFGHDRAHQVYMTGCDAEFHYYDIRSNGCCDKCGKFGH